MEKIMQGIQPSRLTNRELVRYAEWAMTAQGLPAEWGHELIKRLNEATGNKQMPMYSPPQPALKQPA